jgi:hypothetical protein
LKSFWASPTPGCRSDIFFSLFPHDSWTVHFIAHYGKWAEEFERRWPVKNSKYGFPTLILMIVYTSTQSTPMAEANVSQLSLTLFVLSRAKFAYFVFLF